MRAAAELSQFEFCRTVVAAPRIAKCRYRPVHFVAAGAIMACATPAAAHVKWFCGPVDFAQAPLALSDLFSHLFLTCLAAFAAMIAVGAAIDHALSDRVLGLTQKTIRLSMAAPVIARVGMAVYLLCISSNLALVPWADEASASLLAPDIYGTNAIISPLQLTIAGCLLVRRLSLAAAIGIAGLFAAGVMERGVLYMIDYVFFLGIAAYIAADAPWMSRVPWVRTWRNEIVVGTTGIALMWASLDKFLYPQWTIAILFEHPRLAAGYGFDTVATIGGFVEFSLAFYLLVGRELLGRIAAVLLFAVMLIATLEFGLLDLIGHISVLIALALVALHGETRLQPLIRGRPSSLPATATKVSAIFVATLGGMIALFYVLHALNFRN